VHALYQNLCTCLIDRLVALLITIMELMHLVLKGEIHTHIQYINTYIRTELETSTSIYILNAYIMYIYIAKTLIQRSLAKVRYAS
jgi:hypothetical protein